MQTQLKALLHKIRAAERHAKDSDRQVGNNCLFLDADTILCGRSQNGNVRYPYSSDGLIVWAYDSGNFHIQESQFTVVRNAAEGEEPSIAFFLGKKTAKGYTPVSITGVAKQPCENVKRQTVFSPHCVWYLVEAKGILGAVRAFIDQKKRICFSVYCENTGKSDFEGYLASYLNLFLFHMQHDNGECKWYKSCETTDYGFLYRTTEYFRTVCKQHYGAIARSCSLQAKSTTSHIEFRGGMNEQLYAAQALFTGTLPKEKHYTEFTESATAADLIPLKLKPGERFEVSYTISVSDDRAAAEEKVSHATSTQELDQILLSLETEEQNRKEGYPKLSFEGEYCGVSGEKLSYFLKNVTRQVEFCARAKNYAGPYIGVRDIFQQVEGALMWIPTYCRQKIVEALNFLGENGRAPRQYSYPSDPTVPPPMDLRPFIDQGVWIITTLYSYLSFTGDLSVLDEVCGYYRFEGDKVLLSQKRDSVLCHLICIADYLLSNVDEHTHCLHALYGDWNDALDGLGKTTREGLAYGDGVSVMATLQLYRNLKELAAILEKKGVYPQKQAEYLRRAEEIGQGLLDYAVETNGQGERKILHGWGDERSYTVGGFQDNDGYSRDSLTSNAYWIISGELARDPSLKQTILNAYQRLDSKYGLKTFEPYFPPENDKVGRINHLSKGTAENGATYVHATLFGIWSLFAVGETERAYEQLFKILPLTHESITTTPFIMSNSYIYNQEKGFDGESMSDWFTGSGCVLIKVIVWYMFGIKPDLNGINFIFPRQMPYERAKLVLPYRGHTLTVSYRKTGESSFRVDQREVATSYDETLKTQTFYLPHGEVCGDLTVEITR